MNRRLVLTSIATFAATPLSRPNRAGPKRAGRRTVAVVGGPSEAHQGHDDGRLAVPASSRIASPRSTLAHLKQFTEFEIAEQETIADILKAIQSGAALRTDRSRLQRTRSSRKTWTRRARPLCRSCATRAAGAAFDREYLRAEIDGHRKLLDIQEAYLRSPDDLDETNVAKLARGMIKEHLTLLGDMEKTG